MGQPLVSVVIPAYNHERFIGAAVDSVLEQTCDDLELIVVDDGSTDRTGEIVKSYADDRLSYYYQDNQDAFNTINRGIGLATGQFVSILNSDDVYQITRLETLVSKCIETKSVCAFTDVIPISDEGNEYTDPSFGWNVWHRKNRDFYFQCGDLYTAFLKGNFMVTTSNLFMRVEAARGVGPFCSLRYLHDYDFMFRMLGCFPGKVCYLADDKLLYYRIHSGNTLGEAAIVGREQDRELIQKYMLAMVPEEYKKIVSAGSERMVELEKELNDVRMHLYPNDQQGVKPALTDLAKAVKRWLQKKIQ